MNMKRMRGRNHRGGGSGGGVPIRHQTGNVPLNRNHVFDSSGPDLRIRGTSQQLFEKYLQLGRDATSSADRVMAESYFQHAEHYFRILNAMNQAAQTQGQANGAGPQRRQPYESHGNEPQTAEQQQGAEQDDEDDGSTANEQSNGVEQPNSSEQAGEMREIPIAAVPPEH
jgi:hypothetical protein